MGSGGVDSSDRVDGFLITRYRLLHGRANPIHPQSVPTLVTTSHSVCRPAAVSRSIDLLQVFEFLQKVSSGSMVLLIITLKFRIFSQNI